MYQVIIKTAMEQPICHGIYNDQTRIQIRNVVLMTFVLLWNVVAPSLLFAGDIPMSSHVVQANSSTKDTSGAAAVDQNSREQADLIRIERRKVLGKKN